MENHTISNEPPNSNELAIMTFNLRTATAKDSYTWESRCPAAIRLLTEYKPDIIGTQEGHLNQLTDLLTGLPDYDWIGVGRDTGGLGEYMAIFYNQKRFKPLSHRHFWLSDTPDAEGSKTWGNNCTRMVTWVLFEDTASSVKFYVINTHFDHQVAEARKLSSEAVVRELGTLEPDIPVFLTGDFNCDIGSEPYRILTERGKLKDAVHDAAARVGYERTTFHNYTGRENGSTIDWILYSGNVQVKRSEKITYQLEGRYPSDHYPVMVNASIRE
jgi:endonuclease/exonuclease/phosphatase family metal-dependent hydrolase